MGEAVQTSAMDDQAGGGALAEFDEFVDLGEFLEEAPARRLTGGGNAERLVDRHRHDLRYVHTWKRWFVWDGRRFRPDDTGEVMRRAKETTNSIYAAAAAESDPDRRRQLAVWATRSDNESHRREMVNLAACELGIPVRPGELDAKPWYLTVENGTLDLRTGALFSHSRHDLITKLAPVPYDRVATCPTWLAFLDRILGADSELIGFLQRAIGYSLTGDTGEQVLFFLYGTGGNGKSTLLEVLRSLLGDYAKQTDFSTFLERRGEGPRDDIAALQGARFVAAIETSAGRLIAEGLVKQLTGGDTVSARKLYSEYFEFRPAFKLWLAANHKPTIRGTDQAIWRRIRLIPFTVTISEQERDLTIGAKLQDELPGILRWAVEGCLAWQRERLGTPPAVRQATEGYRSEMDVLAGFLEECCELEPAVRTGATPLFKAYRAWCTRTGEREISQRAFGLALAERGFTKVRGGRTGAAIWHGIGLRSDLILTDPSSGTPLEPSPRGVAERRVSKDQITQDELLEREAIEAEGATR